MLVISPTNQILLLHRVRRGNDAFTAAHVFPGGNVDPFHDGTVPAPDDTQRHEDGPCYRLCAIRETFEESGILLAKNNGFGRLIEVDAAGRDEGRKLVHGKQVPFEKWLAGKGGRVDVEGLIPFTRWVTPTNVKKRFTTQMYVYFLPLPTSPTRPVSDASLPIPSAEEAMIPTPDGGIEHTAARFLPAAEWLRQATAGEIILFPPQFFLLSLVGQFLKGEEGLSAAKLGEQRQKLREFIKNDGDPSWGRKCISPTQVMRRKSDGRAVLGLDRPGPELKDSDRKGEYERVVLVNFGKDGPRNVEVRWRKDVMAEEREAGAKL